MLLTITAECVESLLSGTQDGGPLYGRHLSDEGLIRVIGAEPDAGVLIGSWRRQGAVYPQQQGFVQLTVAPHVQPVAVLLASAGPRPLECRVIRIGADYGARTRGLVPTSRLSAACVTVIGIGSGGAPIAAQLARCGVGRLRLVDFDRLETHNIARHICPVADIGRYKTRATRDLLRGVAPLTEVATWEVDVTSDRAALIAAVSDADLVVAVTDQEQAKLAINQVCWPRGIPVVYGAAYNRAFGGDIYCARPPDGACYACLSDVLAELFAPPPTAADLSAGYVDPARMADLIAQPGLSMDVGVIAMLVARVALENLLRGYEGAPDPLPDAWLLFGNRPEWVFQRHLERRFVAVPRREDCPICSPAAQRSAREAAQEARRILESIEDAAEDTSSPSTI